jgi:hypothetical protein
MNYCQDIGISVSVYAQKKVLQIYTSIYTSKASSDGLKALLLVQLTQVGDLKAPQFFSSVKFYKKICRKVLQMQDS